MTWPPRDVLETMLDDAFAKGVGADPPLPLKVAFRAAGAGADPGVCRSWISALSEQSVETLEVTLTLLADADPLGYQESRGWKRPRTVGSQRSILEGLLRTARGLSR